MGKMHKIVLVAACIAPFFAQVADAAIYFRGKEVLRDGKPVADIERLYWAPTPNSSDKDRIQGHLDINIDGSEVSRIMLIFKMFDTKGKLISIFSISPKTCSLHPCDRGLHDFCRRTFPFCGVENSHIKVKKGDDHWRCFEDWKKSECSKNGNIAWFYVDFPRNKEAQSMQIANVVIDGKEVQYNVRIVANKLVRYNLQPPAIKHGTEVELGDESECAQWVPTSDDLGTTAQTGGNRSGVGNQTGRTAGTRNSPAMRSSDSRRGDDDSAYAGVDMSDIETPSSLIPEPPLRIDVSPLVALRRGFTGKAYKCKEHLDNFSSAVEHDNNEAEEKRAKIDRAVSDTLKNKLGKAQSEGNADLAASIMTAMAAFPDEIDDGGSSEVAKVFQARNRRLAQIDRELAQDALNAAKTFNAALAEQKGVWTKKGELDVAKTIAKFQRALSAWMKQVLSNGETPAQPVVQPPTNQPSQQLPSTYTTGSAVSDEVFKAGHTLTGTQMDVSVTLVKSDQPYFITEQYLIPEGSELVVEAGTKIVFGEGASLYCEGILRMNGSEEDTIVCQGRMSKAGYWNGITVKTQGSSLEFVCIFDAKTGITTVNGPKVRNCVFAKNEIGVKLGSGRHGQSFENCLISRNAKYGVDAGSSNSVLFEGCTIEGSGEWGIHSNYHYGTVALESSKVCNNKKGGIRLHRGGSHATSRNCIFLDNKGFDVENACDDDTSWNFRQNYWGPSVTRILQQRGDGANLPNINDGRDSGRGNIVDVAEFLTDPPENCGATMSF